MKYTDKFKELSICSALRTLSLFRCNVSVFIIHFCVLWQRYGLALKSLWIGAFSLS